MLTMGSLHFLTPRPFIQIVPDWLDHQRFWVAASGAAELASGALLLSPGARARRAGGYVCAATFLAVWPANIQMAVDAGWPDSLYSAALWARAPLQVPLILWALCIAGRQVRH